MSSQVQVALLWALCILIGCATFIGTTTAESQAGGRPPPLQLQVDRSSSGGSLSSIHSTLHAIRLHNWNEERPLDCMLSASSWLRDEGSGEGGEAKWRLQQRWRMQSPTMLIRLQPNAIMQLPTKQVAGPYPLQLAPTPVGDPQSSRWLLQLRCESGVDGSIDGDSSSVGAKTKSKRVLVEPKHGIIVEQGGEVVHHFFFAPTEHHGRSSGRSSALSWLQSASRRCPSAPVWLMRLQHSWARWRRVAWARVSEWPPMAWATQVLRGSLDVAHRSGGWLADVLHLQAFVSIFNAWRLAWAELVCVLKSLAHAVGLEEFPWPSLTSLMILAQLAFMHLLLVLYLLRREEGDEAQRQRRPRLTSLEVGRPSSMGEEKKQVGLASSAHAPPAHKPAHREDEELSERI